MTSRRRRAQLELRPVTLSWGAKRDGAGHPKKPGAGVVDADDAFALSAGMKALGVRVARAVNRVLGRRGPVWADRYHARSLTSPRAVRNALVYVLHNARKHRATLAWIDPCSSAAWFDGYRDEPLTACA